MRKVTPEILYSKEYGRRRLASRQSIAPTAGIAAGNDRIEYWEMT